MINGYFKVLVIGIIYTILGVIFVRKVAKQSNKKMMIFYFSFLISFFYIAGIFTSATRFNNYNLRMLTPLSNVSPFLFSLSLVSIFVSNKVRNRIFKLFVIFNFVMIIAGFLSDGFAIFVNSSYYTFVIFDLLSHVTFGLFTYYLIIAGEFELTKKDFIIDFVTIGFVVLLAFVLNLFFGTSFFGLCLNEEYNIYGMKIFDNYHLSNIVYICCLTVVMFAGYFLYKLIKNKLKV